MSFFNIEGGLAALMTRAAVHGGGRRDNLDSGGTLKGERALTFCDTRPCEDNRRQSAEGR
ncbi:MAG: hypothetical protein KDA93_24370 [Planctomycetaceae bacterium]|nr:hypothetical protein [Planctomycetaceae bacterium]